MKTKAQHLAWCRRRALKYLDAGDIATAIETMNRDLTGHQETKPSVFLVLLAMKIVRDDDAHGARLWIEGFR